LATGSDAEWTLVGTVDSAWATAVDPFGLVSPFAPGSRWSLDWWIGADDRWHVPSTGAVRQRLIGAAPVVETLVRIPGGDAVQRVYGVRGEAFANSDEWVVVEVENRSSVPFAVAFAVRPATPEHLSALSSIAVQPVGGGRDRDPAQAVMIDGRAGLVLPRRPALAAGSAAGFDVADAVLAGDALALGGERWAGVTCGEGLANAAFVFPVAHRTTIRLVLPLGATPGSAPAWPAVIPDADHVAAGWDAHAAQGMAAVVPDTPLGDAVAAARRSLLLAPWSDGLRHAGPRRGRSVVRTELADAARIVAALDRLGHHDEAARTLRRWSAPLVELGDRSPATDVFLVEAVANHRLLAEDQPLFDHLLVEAVAAIARVERAARQGALDPLLRSSCARALGAMAKALELAGQGAGASEVRAATDRVTADREAEVSIPHGPREVLTAAAAAISAGGREGIELLFRALVQTSPTLTFDDHGEPHDLVSAALLLDAVRTLLVHEVDDGLELLPVFPQRWYGGALDVHAAPTFHGRLSYALRWHGTRPALLWELDRRDESRSVRISVPGLDPAWATTAARGEALLAEVVPPDVLEPLELVTEHPDAGTFS